MCIVSIYIIVCFHVVLLEKNQHEFIQCMTVFKDITDNYKGHRQTDRTHFRHMMSFSLPFQKNDATMPKLYSSMSLKVQAH